MALQLYGSTHLRLYDSKALQLKVSTSLQLQAPVDELYASTITTFVTNQIFVKYVVVLTYYCFCQKV